MSWAEEGRGPRLPSWVAKAPLGSVGWVRAQNWDTDREPGTTVTLVTPSHQIPRQRLASEVAGRQGQEKSGLFQALGDSGEGSFPWTSRAGLALEVDGFQRLRAGNGSFIGPVCGVKPSGQRHTPPSPWGVLYSARCGTDIGDWGQGNGCQTPKDLTVPFLAEL